MSRKEEDFERLEGQLARQEVALEKRLNEIRRLEGVNAKLLSALERICDRAAMLDEGIPSDSPGDTQIAAIWSLADAAKGDA